MIHFRGSDCAFNDTFALADIADVVASTWLRRNSRKWLLRLEQERNRYKTCQQQLPHLQKVKLKIWVFSVLRTV